MVRPADLPQPVREHNNHDLFRSQLQNTSSPGPARYTGKGVTEFEKSKIGGVIGREGRRHGALEGSRTASSTGISSARTADGSLLSHLAGEHPGPIYNPKFMDTKLPISFSHTSHTGRSTSAPKQVSGSGSVLGGPAQDATPGPGAYHADLPWDKGVTMALAGRPPINSERDANVPGPGSYHPVKPALRTRSAFIGTAPQGSPGNSSPHSFNSQINTAPYTSLKAMDAALVATRPPCGAGITIPRAGRGNISGNTNVFNNSHIDNNAIVGPGSYDIDSSDKVTQRDTPGVKFSTSRRIPKDNFLNGYNYKNKQSNSNARLLALPPCELESGHGSAPSISFPRDRYSGRGAAGANAGAITDVHPGPKYNPSYTAIDPSLHGGASWGTPSSRARQSASRDLPASSGGDFMAPAASTLGGPQVTIGTAPRFGSANVAKNSRSSNINTNPGPGSYNPTLLKKDPKGVGFSKAKRFGHISHRSAQGSLEVNDTLYYPNYAITRPCLHGRTISRSGRAAPAGNIPGAPDSGPGPGSYTINDSNTRADGRSAILYLTG